MMAEKEANRPPEKAAGVSGRGRGRGIAATANLPREQKWVGARLWKMLLASFVLHALLSPAPLLIGLGGLLPLLAPPVDDLPPEEALTAIPIDLLREELPSKRSPEPALEEPSSPQSPQDQTTIVEPDAPAQGPEPAEPNEKASPAEAPPEEETEPPPKEFADPVSLAGSAGKLADSNAHVRIMIYNDVIRSHPLGPRVGSLLRRTPQWRDFFGPSGVDPVRDVDRVLIAGPQLRDSSNVVAVVEHRLADPAIEEALSRLVARSGEWLRKAPPLARARADRAERIFAAPRSGLVAVAPPSAEDSVRHLGPNLSFPAGPEGVAVQAFIDRPHRPLRALGLRIPKSLEWLRVELEPQADGGLKIRILAQDASPKEARKNAAELQALLRSAAEVDFGRLGTLGALASLAFGGPKQKVVESIDLFAEKDQIRGLVRMTREQLLNVSDLLDAFLPPEPRPSVVPEADPADGERERASDASGEERPKKGGPASETRDEGPASDVSTPRAPTPPSDSGEPGVPAGTEAPPSAPEHPE